MIKYYCDKCGKEIEKRDVPFKLFCQDCSNPPIITPPNIYHLCPDCLNEFFRWIDNKS